MKASLSAKSSLLSVSWLKEMMCVSIACSFSSIRVWSGDTRIHHPQRCAPEMQDPSHSGSSAGDWGPFVVSEDQGYIFWYPFRTHFTVLQMLVDDGVNSSFTRVEFITDVTGPNSSICCNHLINGCNAVVGDHDVCLTRSWQIRYRLPPFTKTFTLIVHSRLT